MTNESMRYRVEQGIGFVEVLVATVVIALGLLSLASMQGNFISASGDNKTRAEAIMLAEAKIEEVRNNLIQDDAANTYAALAYNELVSSNVADSIAGVNASFSRSWAVSDETSPDRKRINVSVSWGNAADEVVNIASEIAWADPGRSAAYASGGNGLSGVVPSPNNRSSEINDNTFDSGTALNDGSGLSTFTDENGDIFLLTPLNVGFQAVRKFNGGVIHTIKGNVYHGVVGNGGSPSVTLTPTTDYPIAFSDLAYCVFPVTEGKSDYICYFGGDCENSGSGCPEVLSDFDSVNGGWYGKVGLTETDGTDFQNKKVCFAEDIAGTGIETAATTARFYATHRVNADNNLINYEGINQSFKCQNFLIVEKRGSSYPCSYFSDYVFGDSNIAVSSASIGRVLPLGTSNTVLAEDTTKCNSTSKHIITGNITGEFRDQVVVMANNDACLISIDDSNNFKYICTLETTSTTAKITAYNGNVSPAIQTVDLPDPSTSTGIDGGALVTSGETPVPVCVTSWGVSVNYGEAITAFPSASVAVGSVCSSESIICDYGVFSKTPYEVCDIQNTGDCNVLPWGDILNTHSVTASPTKTVDSPATCSFEQRTCSDGLLSGTYAFDQCDVVQPTSECTVTVSGSITKGSPGSKVTDASVTVTAVPGGACIKQTTSNNLGSYACSFGVLNEGSSVTVGGTKVSGGSPVVIDCLSSGANAGPELITTQ